MHKLLGLPIQDDAWISDGLRSSKTRHELLGFQFQDEPVGLSPLFGSRPLKIKMGPRGASLRSQFPSVTHLAYGGRILVLSNLKMGPRGLEQR